LTPLHPSYTSRAGVLHCAAAKVSFEQGCISSIGIIIAVEITIAGAFSIAGV